MARMAYGVKEEKREFRRYPLDVPAAVEASVEEGAPRVVALQSEDISVGGIGLRTHWTFPNGTELLVRAILPNGERVEAKGVVVRGTLWNMGIQFNELVKDLPSRLFS